MARPGTLGELKTSGWVSRPVKEEVRANAIARISEGKQLVDGVIGYEDTVLPQLENALIAGHDVIFLGERGQAKTRMIRWLTELLDEWMPIIAGSEINDDPYDPVSQHARLLVAERGDEAPIEWVHRDRRFGEKLATPDTSIADLIGDVDPIKVAEGRYLSDELTIHYGLVPRTNRGIFSINELPDLAERIQVGLLNVLEERDVQIRGYKIRLPIDIMLVASANPEDYTNRGRIITPLKDRFGAQIRTHYPLDAELEAAVVEQEARPLVTHGLNVHVPELHDRDRGGDEPAGTPVAPHQPAFRCVGAALDRQLRDAGRERDAGVRCATAKPKWCSASATSRRWLPAPPARWSSRPSTKGAKSRCSTASSRRRCSRRSVRTTRPEKLTELVQAFDSGLVVHTGEDIASSEYTKAPGRHAGSAGGARRSRRR